MKRFEVQFWFEKQVSWQPSRFEIQFGFQHRSENSQKKKRQSKPSFFNSNQFKMTHQGSSAQGSLNLDQSVLTIEDSDGDDQGSNGALDSIVDDNDSLFDTDFANLFDSVPNLSLTVNTAEEEDDEVVFLGETRSHSPPDSSHLHLFFPEDEDDLDEEVIEALFQNAIPAPSDPSPARNQQSAANTPQPVSSPQPTVSDSERQNSFVLPEGLEDSDESEESDDEVEYMGESMRQPTESTTSNLRTPPVSNSNQSSTSPIVNNNYPLQYYPYNLYPQVYPAPPANSNQTATNSMPYAPYGGPYPTSSDNNRGRIFQPQTALSMFSFPSRLHDFITEMNEQPQSSSTTGGTAHRLINELLHNSLHFFDSVPNVLFASRADHADPVLDHILNFSFQFPQVDRRKKATQDDLKSTTEKFTPKEKLKDDCPICLEEMNATEEVMKLSCGHIYHSKCISKWLTEQSNTCPTCRKTVEAPPKPKTGEKQKARHQDTRKRKRSQTEEEFQTHHEEEDASEVPTSHRGDSSSSTSSRHRSIPNRRHLDLFTSSAHRRSGPSSSSSSSSSSTSSSSSSSSSSSRNPKRRRYV